MMLDWRDRPTAKELLEDEWWDDDDGNTAVPGHLTFQKAI